MTLAGPDDEVVYPEGLNALDGGDGTLNDDHDEIGDTASARGRGKVPKGKSPQINAAAAPANGSGSNKRKRVVVSLYQKQQVLHRLENGEKPAEIANLLGISRQQISDIKKNKERIMRFCGDAKHLASLRRKTLKVSDDEAFPAVERELYRWMITEKCNAKPVTYEALHQKAAELLAQATGTAIKPEEPSTWPGVSPAWMKSFKKRYGIKELGGPMPTYDVEDGAINMGMPLESNEELNLSMMSSVHANLHALGEMGISMEGDNLAAAYSQAAAMAAAKDNAAKMASPLHHIVETIHVLNGRMDALEQMTRERIAQLDARIDDIYMVVHPKLKNKDGNRNAYKVV